MEIKISKWSVIWIFPVFVMKLSEGLASTNGELLFSPSSLVPVGTNLTIICITKQKSCRERSTFLFEINRDKRNPDWQNQTTAMIQLVNITEGYHVTCYLECHWLRYVINMTQLQVGYPPDQPTNIECRWEEFSTEMRCNWDTGRATGLPTYYKVHVQNLHTGQDTYRITTEAAVRFPMNVTHNETHQIQVFAENPLNQSGSVLVQFLLADIVVPLTPVIRTIDISNTSLTIYINWRNQMSEKRHYCAVEYKTLKTLSWVSAGEEMNRNNMVSMRRIRRVDSVRVRCREESGRRYWSKWSAPYQIPATAPEDIPDVWRLLGQQLPDGAQEVSILIASDPDDPPRNNISRYEVYYYNGGVPTGVTQCPPSGVQCVALIPGGVQTVFIAASNPYGLSPEADLPIHEEDGSGPQEVSVRSLSPTSVSVEWRHPPTPAEILRWYVVQWSSDTCDGKHRNVSWRKTGTERRNITITDQVAPGQHITISLYAVYSTKVSRPSTVYGYSQEFKPRSGPGSIRVVSSSLNSRLIEWGEIPLCDRQGFITGYTVYITQYPNESNFMYEVPGSTRRFLFDKCNPEAQYSVCISASTRAGEGPASHCTNFHQDQSLSSYVGLLVAMAFGVIVVSTMILTLSRIRKRVKKALTLLLPKCLHEEYPHIERSAAVKSLQENEEGPGPFLGLLSSDPETVEIEELPKEVTSPPMTPTSPAQETQSDVSEEESEIAPANIEVEEHTSGYRPQITNGSSQRRNSYCGPEHMLDLQRIALGSGMPWIPTNNLVSSTITNDVFQMNLRVTNGTDLDDDPPLATTGLTLQSLWDSQTFIEGLVIPGGPGDPVISTPSLLEDHHDTKSYFPQIFSGGL
ncbi:interleukin-23 receptor [Leptodactylus fuscus]|uniref:interleukin-23 receptor n=1 Tax=Leptodactylus fuscus TaxID=238119 RepID=UPI003F4EFD49